MDSPQTWTHRELTVILNPVVTAPRLIGTMGGRAHTCIAARIFHQFPYDNDGTLEVPDAEYLSSEEEQQEIDSDEDMVQRSVSDQSTEIDEMEVDEVGERTQVSDGQFDVSFIS